MDGMLGVNHIMKNQKQARRKRSKAIKVVYISSPMKVKTSASKFRDLVQELTGRHSNVAGFMENNGGGASDDYGSTMAHDQVFKGVDDSAPRVPRVDPYGESPTSSESLFEAFDDVFVPQMEENSFVGMFPSSFLYDSSQIDVFRSFGAV